MKTIKLTLVLSLFFLSAHAFETAEYDSLGIKTIDGVSFIYHKVQSNETLYSLLRRYGCNSADFARANPDLNGKSTIYINQTLKFPTQVAVQEEPVKTAIVSERKSGDQPVKSDIAEMKITSVHHVGPNETLYSISKNYNIDIDEIKALNKLESNDIALGQTLLIRKSRKEYEDAMVSEYEKNFVFPENLKPDKIIVPNAPTGEKMEEIGIAEVISTTKSSNKMLALHKTAPLGSLMMVRNTATGNQVLVKVIGKLPDTGNNENVLVRLSPSAFYKLNPKDIRINAKVTYHLPPNS